MIDIEYWHWIVFGLILSSLELVIPSFMVLWFGLSAIITGLLLYFFPTVSLTIQLMIWLALSISIALLWFKFLKPVSSHNRSAEQIKHSLIKETGTVIKTQNNNETGVLRLSVPFGGADEWRFLCDEKLMLGDRVVIIDQQEDTLKVIKGN